LPDGVSTAWPAHRRQWLTKLRYDVPLGDLVASVDVYTGRSRGLRVVEASSTRGERRLSRHRGSTATAAH